MIPYSRPKLASFYTLSHSKLLENHPLHSGKYLYRLYMAAFAPTSFPEDERPWERGCICPPPPPGVVISLWIAGAVKTLGVKKKTFRDQQGNFLRKTINQFLFILGNPGREISMGHAKSLWENFSISPLNIPFPVNSTWLF